MKDGFIKVAAATPQIEVADCIHNTQEIVKKAKEMSAAGAKRRKHKCHCRRQSKTDDAP